jgi:hypothetical protein
MTGSPANAATPLPAVVSASAIAVDETGQVSFAGIATDNIIAAMYDIHPDELAMAPKTGPNVGDCSNACPNTNCGDKCGGSAKV